MSRTHTRFLMTVASSARFLMFAKISASARVCLHKFWTRFKCSHHLQLSPIAIAVHLQSYPGKQQRAGSRPDLLMRCGMERSGDSTLSVTKGSHVGSFEILFHVPRAHCRVSASSLPMMSHSIQTCMVIASLRAVAHMASPSLSNSRHAQERIEQLLFTDSTLLCKVGTLFLILHQKQL